MTFGRYRVVGELGRGGMGVVYRAVDEATGAAVAVKTVTATASPLLAGIRREIAALARVRHPGVVRILDDGVAGGVPWYAMEVLEGRSLRSMLLHAEAVAPTASLHAVPEPGAEPAGASPLAVDDVVALACRLCGPLAFLHGEGVVHGDLKPENVLLRADGSPVLTDFGLATSFAAGLSRESLAEGGGAEGTLWYISPERLLGEPVDARADLYALGCMLHELLTGSPPFVGPSAGDVIRRHLEEPAVPPSRSRAGIPSELDGIVLSLLEKDPARRQGYADAVAAQLSRLGGGSVQGAALSARPYLYRARLAGRDDVLEDLAAAVEGVARGRGAIVLLEGESGAGKTRVAQAAAARAMECGCLVLTGTCADVVAEERAPLQALERALLAIADLCREGGGARAARVVGAVGKVLAPYQPAFGSLAPGAPEPADLPPDLARRRVCESLEAVLSALAREMPLVLVLDDLQWADELTLAFLSHVARSIEGTRVLVTATCRTEEQVPGIDALRRSPAVERIALGRLEGRDVATIAGSMLALPDPPEDLVLFLADATKGNPFFVGEYLRAAVAEGLLERSPEGKWRPSARASAGGSFRDLGLPAPLLDLVGRRLTHLSAEARAVLHAAGVLGDDIAEDHLASVSGLDPAIARDASVELVAGHVLSGQRNGLLGFAHAKIREVARASLPEGRSRDLHRRAAEVLEGDPAARRDRVAAIARHWEAGGAPERAWPLYAEAARRALAVFARDQAEGLFRAHLRLAPASDATVSARLELAELVLGKRGDAAAALEEARTALREARAIGSRLSEARSQRELGRQLLAMGDVGASRDALGEARRIYTEIGDETGHAATAVTLGDLEDSVGDKARAEASYRHAVATFERHGDGRRLGPCLSRMGDLAADRGRLDEARDLYGRAVAQHRMNGDPVNECVTLGNLAALHIRAGDLEAARPVFEEALRIVLEVGDRPSAAVILLNYAHLDQIEGRFGDALPRYDLAVRYARETASKRIEAIARAMRTDCQEALGESDVVEELREALRLAREAGDRWFEPDILSRLARRLPEPEARCRALQEALGMHEAAGAHASATMTRLALARAQLDHGRGPEAARTAADAVARLRSGGDRGLLAEGLLVLAKVLRETGSPGAPEALDEAASLHLATGLRLGIARVACERARQAAAGGGDPSRHVDLARDVLRELGLPAASALGREIAAAAAGRAGPAA